jgi:hypothetical protein
MKVLLTFFVGMLAVTPSFGAELGSKNLRVGMETVEPVGSIKDENPFTALRRVRCIDFDSSNVQAEGPANEVNGLELREAIILAPGSRIVLRRTAFNDYNAQIRSSEMSVVINCEK